MRDNNKPNAKSQALLKESLEFQSALQKAGFAEATQKIYLRDVNKFTKRLDRKTPATATLKEAKLIHSIGGSSSKDPPREGRLMNRMMLTSREQPISVCNALHTARYPCVSGPRNAACRALSAVHHDARTASERVCFRTDPAPETVPTPSHVPHNLRGAVENT